ncbi:MAG: DUF3187 family protein [Candidatus Thiodiazotropha sp.]|jgi:hypothetical protein
MSNFRFFRRVLNPVMTYWRIFLLFGLSVFSIITQAQAPDSEPFNVRNMNPYILLHGLPVATSARTLKQGESSFGLYLSVANSAIDNQADGEWVILDGETYQATLDWKEGIGSGWQLGIEVPYISHRSGGLDNLIESWHDLFGFSNSERDDLQQNKIRYWYRDGDAIEVNIDKNMSGFGDLQFQLSRAVPLDDKQLQASLHVSLKLPTGDEETLLGSGAPDLAFWLSGSDRQLLEGWPVGGYAQMGILVMGMGKVFSEQQRRFALFGTLGTSWLAKDWLQIKFQLDSHTPLYNSRLDQLGSAILFTLGGSILMDGGHSQVDLSIGENLTIDSVPDFTLNLGYRVFFH